MECPTVEMTIQISNCKHFRDVWHNRTNRCTHFRDVWHNRTNRNTKQTEKRIAKILRSNGDACVELKLRNERRKIEAAENKF
jgi:hypothetical protein